jgi:hypothetical protein
MIASVQVFAAPVRNAHAKKQVNHGEEIKFGS